MDNGGRGAGVVLWIMEVQGAGVMLWKTEVQGAGSCCG